MFLTVASTWACDMAFERGMHVDVHVDAFRTVTVDDVRRVLSTMPSKSSPLDVVPTSLMKSCDDIFSRIIAHLVNLSFTEGDFHCVTRLHKSFHWQPTVITARWHEPLPFPQRAMASKNVGGNWIQLVGELVNVLGWLSVGRRASSWRQPGMKSNPRSSANIICNS